MEPKVKELVAEHTKLKVATAQKVLLNAAELGSQMKSLNKRWSDDVKWGAKLNMHSMYIIISGNPDITASKHNTMVCGMSSMQKWCKAELPVHTLLLPKIHSYIIATEWQTGIQPTQAPKWIPPDIHAKWMVCVWLSSPGFSRNVVEELLDWSSLGAVRNRLTFASATFASTFGTTH
jgi:hypothetical protein